MEPRSPALQADSLPAEPQGKPIRSGIYSEMELLDHMIMLFKIFEKPVFHSSYTIFFQYVKE